MKLLLLTAIIACSTAAFSQTNFTGTWTLTGTEAVEGPQYANALPSGLTITQTKDSLVIESTNTGADGTPSTSRQSLNLNGKPSSITSAVSKRRYTRSLAWSPDKKSLVLTTLFSMPENENEVDFTRIETWTLSPDGRQLTVDKRSVETRSETWETKGLFTKQ